jgi:menaquinone-dependent protoporphyrinogen oxidase
MQVVIATGSRHGSTHDIGDRLAATLKKMGIEAISCDVSEVQSLEEADAVVLGSAVYLGQWTKEAQEFVERFRAELLVMPTWVFSSGPVGEPPKPDADPPAHVNVRDAVEAEDDRVFPGALNRDHLGLGEKLIVKVIGVEDGDFRPWDEIEEFAREIGEALLQGKPEVSHPVE